MLILGGPLLTVTLQQRPYFRCIKCVIMKQPLKSDHLNKVTNWLFSRPFTSLHRPFVGRQTLCLRNMSALYSPLKVTFWPKLPFKLMFASTCTYNIYDMLLDSCCFFYKSLAKSGQRKKNVWQGEISVGLLRRFILHLRNVWKQITSSWGKWYAVRRACWFTRDVYLNNGQPLTILPTFLSGHDHNNYWLIISRNNVCWVNALGFR